MTLHCQEVSIHLYQDPPVLSYIQTPGLSSSVPAGSQESRGLYLNCSRVTCCKTCAFVFSTVGKWLGKILLSGTYSLVHKDLASEKSSALDRPSVNISAMEP